jgi:hypothetical protein
VLPLAAIMLVVLTLMAAVAIDAGRFLAERRFLQNAADAATLAAASTLGHALADGDDEATARSRAEAQAREILDLQFTRDPAGNPVPDGHSCAIGPPRPCPPLSPVYDPACGGAPPCLIEGILIDGREVRVALRNDVDFTFGRIAGLTDAIVAARARTAPDNDGHLIPVAVREFIRPNGPYMAASPCSYDDAHFVAVFTTVATSCLGTASDSSGRVAASVAAPGPTVEILGLGSDPANSPGFRGFVALDIRNFENESSRELYNGLDGRTNTNSETFKDMQAAYIVSGYPGPPLETPMALPDPRWQVATMDGNSAGIAVDRFWQRFRPGDLAVVLVYDGIVKQLPEFYLNWPNSNSLGQIALPTTGNASVALQVSRNAAFTANVNLTAVADPDDPSNPLNTDPPQAGPIAFSSTPVTPATGSGTVVDVSAVTDNAVAGIYPVWLVGQSTQYDYHYKYLPLSLNVGNVQRDFTVGAPQSNGPAERGGNVSFTIPLFNASSSPSRRFNGPVDLSLETLAGTPLDTIASGVTPGQNVSRDVTISTAGLSNGAHRYAVRATGVNGDGLAVTHLLPLTVFVGFQTPGSDTYVDVTGFAAMEIMCAPVPSCTPPNQVYGRALTPVVTSLDDELLSIATTSRLVPWDY